MSNLGTRLKQARESLGVDLRDVAATTKISVTALEALERNDFSRLPGGIFGRSFVRAYATAVGLDPDAAVEEFVAALQQSARDAERNARQPEISKDDRAFLERQERAVRQLRIAVAVAVVLIIAAAIWWFWGRSRAPDAAPQKPAGEAASPADPRTAGPAARRTGGRDRRTIEPSDRNRGPWTVDRGRLRFTRRQNALNAIRIAFARGRPCTRRRAVARHRWAST